MTFVSICTSGYIVIFTVSALVTSHLLKAAYYYYYYSYLGLHHYLVDCRRPPCIAWFKDFAAYLITKI